MKPATAHRTGSLQGRAPPGSGEPAVRPSGPSARASDPSDPDHPDARRASPRGSGPPGHAAPGTGRGRIRLGPRLSSDRGCCRAAASVSSPTSSASAWMPCGSMLQAWTSPAAWCPWPGSSCFSTTWSTKTRRWCGRCLREDRMAARLDRQARHPGPWHRASWDIRSVAVCPTHDVALSDRCQACRRAQSFRGPALDRCPCGADLAETEAGTTAGAAEREIEDAGRITSCYIAGRLGLGPRTALPLVDAFPLKDAISTLERLGTMQCACLWNRRA